VDEVVVRVFVVGIVDIVLLTIGIFDIVLLTIGVVVVTAV
jgi:hypothetical protein